MQLTSLDARILLMAGHFVATCLTASTRGMEGGEAFLVFSSFALGFVSIVGGWELFANKVGQIDVPSRQFPMDVGRCKNALHATAHFVGGLMQAHIVLHALPTTSYLWYVVLFAHAPATTVTLSSLPGVFGSSSHAALHHASS